MPARFWNLIMLLLIEVILLPACTGAMPSPTHWIAPAIIQTQTADIAEKSSGAQAAGLTPSPPQPPTATPLSQVFHTTTTPLPEQTTRTNPQYNISVEFDYAVHNLSVVEHIEYTNNLTEPLNDLALMIEPLLHPGAFIWQRFSWADGTPILHYDLYPGYLIIPLEQPLESGERRSLWIEYELQLPYLDPEAAFRQLGPLGYTELQTNLADWYPFVPPYSPGKGWLAHQPASYGEHLVYEMADFEVIIQLTGKMSDLVIAASSEGNIENSTYRYQIKNARNFTWSASPYYRTKTSTAGNVTVNSYYFPDHWAGGQRVLTTTVETIELFSHLFAPYSHSTISAIEADFVDGMEYDGLYFLGKDYYAQHNRRTADFLVTIAAHETAHQWWYGLVGNDQALEPWLDESLSTYCEYLFYEYLHPEDMDWWWTYRLMAYQPHGSIDITIYDVQGTNRYRDYRDAVYLNGALFIHDIRKFLGDQEFIDFLGIYLETHQYTQATTTDFFYTLKDYIDGDFHSLIKDYFSQEIYWDDLGS